MYVEDDLLPLSGLQHLAFCPRQWALIHLEAFWADNRLTVEGRHLHDRAHLPTVETRGDVRIVRGLRLHSLHLGVVGQADVVEFHRIGDQDAPTATDAIAVPGVCLPGVRGRWRPFPIEYKRGRPKPGDCDRVQLCAQAICLEEMLGAIVPAGALFYGQTRRRQEINFDAALRQRTADLAGKMHTLFAIAATPRPAYDRRKCGRCSLYDRCLPKTASTPQNIRLYLASALETDGTAR